MLIAKECAFLRILREVCYSVSYIKSNLVFHVSAPCQSGGFGGLEPLTPHASHRLQFLKWAIIVFSSLKCYESAISKTSHLPGPHVQQDGCLLPPPSNNSPVSPGHGPSDLYTLQRVGITGLSVRRQPHVSPFCFLLIRHTISREFILGSLS